MFWELGGYFQEGGGVKISGGGGASADPQEKIWFLKEGGQELEQRRKVGEGNPGKWDKMTKWGVWT